MSLEIAGLHYAYGERKALDGVGLSVEPGQFCALLGPNGAGKSTLFALLTRLFVASEGSIRVAGQDLSASPRKALARIGVVFQQSTLDADLTVTQNMRYFAALHGISGRTGHARIEEVLARMEIADRAGERVRNLNGGHRRRAEIARSLIHRPAVLMLDEPTVGLDAASRAAITAHVHELCADRGVTVLWATHLTDEVRAGDRLVILHRGRIVADGVAGDIAGDEDLRDVFLRQTGGESA